MGSISYSKPLGIRFVEWINRRPLSYRTHQAIVLLLTFFAYTMYHNTRKITSVVKSTLDPESSAVGMLPRSLPATMQPPSLYSQHSMLRLASSSRSSSSFPPFNNSLYIPESVLDVKLLSSSGWPPFNGTDGSTLLGELDLSFLVCYATGMYLSGQIGDRVNLRIFLTVGMFGTALFTTLYGVAYWANIHMFFYFVIVQMLAGLFQSTGWPSVVGVVGEWFGKSKRGLIMGIWNAHTSVGNITGSLLAAAMLSYGWGWSFVVPSLIMVFIGVVVFFFLPVSPQSVGLSSNTAEAEREPLLNSEMEKSERAIGFIEAWKIPGVAPFAFCLFFTKLVAYTFMDWLPFYISHTEIGGVYYSSATSGDLSTIFDVGGVIGGILAGHISDKLDARAITSATFMYCSIPVMYLYRSFGHINLPINAVLMFITGIFVNGPYALITTAVSADLGTHGSVKGNSRALSTVTAIIDGTGSVGAALGPLLTGYVSAKSWTLVFIMLMTSALISALLLTRLVVAEVAAKIQARRLRSEAVEV
ncbi:hypothetical protein MLD38_015646 [Melastoma candidum]|uniref:Uncharacterized protein n=1 Tax=Melastoma candidum TaxID=119954 RepID=A0ACB9RGN3_9MYRT|nr:hypothetical protein MLD38_015646 [Melastoma candidum]